VAECIEVARLDELPVGRGTVVTIANTDVALFNVDGTVYAMDDTCLHQGLS
jgi:nitrite reductase/ring-hydroxylating ferredoxin subunit